MSIPEVFFRETIDINRYSNAVSADFVRTYNDVILLAARKLNAINIRQAKAGEGVVIAPQTKKRLRAIIAQSKSSLDKWSKTTTKKMIKEIEGLAKVQAGFIEGELKKVVKSGNIPINSVAVSSKYAESFVTTDPTKVNIFTSKQFTEDDFKRFGQGKFELTARQGAMQTLPNGETVEKAFRGIATRQQEGLARTIRQGVFSGESTQQIASRMIGRLEFGQKGSVRQIAQAGGELTKLANHQIQTIVRTSVNQVQNQASQAVYAANSKVAPKYEYVATLDSRTSPICKRLDGRKFEYNKGPTPPQHFNCRSTTVPVVDYAGLKKQKGFEDLTPPPKGKVVTRPTGEGTGRVPQDTQYGDWLLGQDKKLKVKTLGNEQKVRYFERLAKKEGSGQKAIRKMVREDGSERSLKDLERLYGKPRDITIRTKTPKPVAKPVGFERRLVDSSPEQLRKAGKELMEEVGVLDVNKLKKLDAEYVKTAKEAATNMAALDKFDKAKNAYLKYKESFTNSLEKLRNKMLDTPLNDTQIDKFIKNVKITTFNAAQKTELRGQLNEYIRMFNGNGFVDSANGIPAITKIGKAQRASCKFWEGSMTASARTRKVGSKFLNVRKATTFHEISHSVEVANPKLNKYLNKWKLNKGFTDIDKIIDAMENKKASIVKKPTEKLGKPVYKLDDIRRGGYRKDEVALVNEYISPYMGKVYEPYDFSKLGITLDTEPSEVLSMSIERFAGTESMTKLLMQHPDLFEIVVGMSRATGL